MDSTPRRRLSKTPRAMARRGSGRPCRSRLSREGYLGRTSIACGWVWVDAGRAGAVPARAPLAGRIRRGTSGGVGPLRAR